MPGTLGAGGEFRPRKGGAGQSTAVGSTVVGKVRRTLVWLKFQDREIRGQFPHWAQGAGQLAPGPLIFCASSGMRPHAGSLVGLPTPQTEFSPIRITTNFHPVISILGKRHNHPPNCSHQQPSSHELLIHHYSPSPPLPVLSSDPRQKPAAPWAVLHFWPGSSHSFYMSDLLGFTPHSNPFSTFKL